MNEKEKAKKEIGERLRKLRKYLKLNQGEMSVHIDIGRADLSSTERGRIYPTVYVLYLLKKKFNVSLNWILFNDGEMFYSPPVKRRKNSGLNPLNEELHDLFFHIENIPMVRHAVLSFYYDFRVRNQDLINDTLKSSLEEESPSE
ncbi:MAG: Helix-turn-helix protein [Acidobacteriota bacterium]|nr:Helix-turn-helix protein [Acidobacteriota bacterium]